MWNRTASGPDWAPKGEWQTIQDEIAASGATTFEVDDEGDTLFAWNEEGPFTASDLQAHFETIRPQLREGLIAHIVKRFELSADSPLYQGLHALDRRTFVPDHRRVEADSDSPVYLGHDMTESALHAVVMTLLAIEPKPGDNVLICGAKGGYLAALTAAMVGEEGSVCCLDWQTPIVEHVTRSLEHHPSIAKRVDVLEVEDVTIGYEPRSPWQIVVFNGALPRIPYDVLHQLDDEVGRLLFYLKDGRSDVCHVVYKNDDIVKEESLSRFRFTGIPGAKYGFESISNLQSQYDAAKKASAAARTDLGHIQGRIPYPLARTFMSAFNAREASERHARTLKAYEVLIKYLAMPCLSQFDKTGDSNKRFSQLMTSLGAKPSLGHWLGALREASALVSDTGCGKVIARDHMTKVKNRAVLEAYQMLEQQTGKPEAGLKKAVLVRNLLQKVVTYRNKSGEGHGAISSTQQLGEYSQLLLDALRGLLAELRIFQTYDLVAIEEIRNLPRKRVCLTVRRLDGVGPVVETWEREADGGHLEPGVYLAKGRVLQLGLAPWMIWAEGKNNQPELFLYNGPTHKGMFHYLAYHNKDEYPSPDEQDDIREFLGRHRPPPPPKFDPEQARQMFSMMMQRFVEDGVIDAQEMMLLTQQVVMLGLVDSPDQVRDFIQSELDEHYPEVYVE